MIAANIQLTLLETLTESESLTESLTLSLCQRLCQSLSESLTLSSCWILQVIMFNLPSLTLSLWQSLWLSLSHRGFLVFETAPLTWSSAFVRVWERVRVWENGFVSAPLALKFQVYFAEYRLFYRAFLQKETYNLKEPTNIKTCASSLLYPDILNEDEALYHLDTVSLL